MAPNRSADVDVLMDRLDAAGFYLSIAAGAGYGWTVKVTSTFQANHDTYFSASRTSFTAALLAVLSEAEGVAEREAALVRKADDSGSSSESPTGDK